MSTTWREHASCTSTPDLFFNPRQEQQAKRVCGTCPVKADCLPDALTNGSRFGVQAGLSARERRDLGGVLAAEAFAFAPKTQAQLDREWQAEQTRLERIAAAMRARRSLADAVHPFDRK